MTQTTYHNSPLRNCRTCAHSVPDSDFSDDPGWDHCARWNCYTFIAVARKCGDDLKEWRPQPPQPPKPSRRSLRRWLLDLLWT